MQGVSGLFYPSINGYSGICRHVIDNNMKDIIVLDIIHIKSKKTVSSFVLEKEPTNQSLKAFVDDYPSFIELLKEGGRHE